jgi:hypothetical protein
VIFSVQTTIGSLRALPPNIQTISRKLQFSPLEMRIPAPTEPKQLQMVHSRGVLQIPSSLRNMNAFSLRISEEAQCLFLDYLAHSDQVKSLTIPHQLIEVAAKMFPPQLKGLRMHPNFDPRTAIAHLPKHLTKLTFASEIELLSDLGVDFPILPCLEELTVRSEDISVLLDHKWQHHTPSLRKLSFKFVSEPQAEDFPATLQELIITKSRRIGEASSSFFEVLPRSLKFFSLRHRCRVEMHDIIKLPENMIHLTINAGPWEAEAIKLLPPKIQTLTYNRFAWNWAPKKVLVADLI